LSGAGGGLALADVSASITKCTFKSNTAKSTGGALWSSYTQAGMTLKLTASTFDGNQASC